MPQVDKSNIDMSSAAKAIKGNISIQAKKIKRDNQKNNQIGTVKSPILKQQNSTSLILNDSSNSIITSKETAKSMFKTKSPIGFVNVNNQGNSEITSKMNGNGNIVPTNNFSNNNNLIIEQEYDSNNNLVSETPQIINTLNKGNTDNIDNEIQSNYLGNVTPKNNISNITQIKSIKVNNKLSKPVDSKIKVQKKNIEKFKSYVDIKLNEKENYSKLDVKIQIKDKKLATVIGGKFKTPRKSFASDLKRGVFEKHIKASNSDRIGHIEKNQNIKAYNKVVDSVIKQGFMTKEEYKFLKDMLVNGRENLNNAILKSGISSEETLDNLFHKAEFGRGMKHSRLNITKIQGEKLASFIKIDNDDNQINIIGQNNITLNNNKVSLNNDEKEFIATKLKNIDLSFDRNIDGNKHNLYSAEDFIFSTEINGFLKEHLTDEFSIENIDFILDIRNAFVTDDKTELINSLDNIYTEYIDIGSNSQVNISSNNRKLAKNCFFSREKITESINRDNKLIEEENNKPVSSESRIASLSSRIKDNEDLLAKSESELFEEKVSVVSECLIEIRNLITQPFGRLKSKTDFIAKAINIDANLSGDPLSYVQNLRSLNLNTVTNDQISQSGTVFWDQKE